MIFMIYFLCLSAFCADSDPTKNPSDYESGCQQRLRGGVEDPSDEEVFFEKGQDTSESSDEGSVNPGAIFGQFVGGLMTAMKQPTMEGQSQAVGKAFGRVLHQAVPEEQLRGFSTGLQSQYPAADTTGQTQTTEDTQEQETRSAPGGGSAEQQARKDNTDLFIKGLMNVIAQEKKSYERHVAESLQESGGLGGQPQGGQPRHPCSQM